MLVDEIDKLIEREKRENKDELWLFHLNLMKKEAIEKKSEEPILSVLHRWMPIYEYHREIRYGHESVAD